LGFIATSVAYDHESRSPWETVADARRESQDGRHRARFCFGEGDAAGAEALRAKKLALAESRMNEKEQS
jgi:hypothetical protein